MKKFGNEGDETADEKNNRPQSDMLMAREKALKATLKANEILAKAGSVQKELEEMEKKIHSLPMQATRQRVALICFAIIVVVLILLYRNAR